MDSDHFQSLLQRHFDQVLSAPQRSELERLLLESARAREQFWEIARWNALLRQWGEEEWGRRDAVAPAESAETPLHVLPPPAQPARHRSPLPRATRRAAKVVPFPVWRSWLQAAAAALVVGFLTAGLLAVWRHHSGRSSPILARLAHAPGAVWARGATVPAAGAALHAGWLRLQAGVAEIEFARGARVVLEGPAEFRLVSDNAGLLRSGKLRAYVPAPAHGFTVQAPDFTVVDHGTEFGCSVPLAGVSEVHVFTGSVEMQPAAAPEKRLQLWENQALRLDGGRFNDIPVRRDLFLAEADVRRRERLAAGGRMAVWRQASQDLSDHPAALLHLDFQTTHPDPAGAANLARKSLTDDRASMAGCELTGGRWPGKGAVEFKNPGDRLKITVPGTFKSLTFLAWVRVESLPNAENALVMTSSFQTGEVHWYLTKAGGLGLGIHLPDLDDVARGWRLLHGPPVLTPALLGSWHFVASVFEGETGTVTHYFDGQVVASATIEVKVPLRLDGIDIGNWAVRGDDPQWASVKLRRATDAVRNFQGRMDEIAILAAPLKAEEIRRYFLDGRPGDEPVSVVSVEPVLKPPGTR